MKSEITYFDENEQVTEPEKAVTCIIRQYDDDGQIVNEIFGIC